MVQSSVTLSLPMDASVSFSTELVSVSWRIRFEFVIAPPDSPWAIGGERLCRVVVFVCAWGGGVLIGCLP